MNRQSIQKLTLFVTGLEQRISENIQFFNEIKVEYKSGTKIFNAVIEPEGNRLKMNFAGENKIIEIHELSKSLAYIAESYESMTLFFEERGNRIIIQADNKNVKMKTSETKMEEIPGGHNDSSQLGNREYYIKPGQAHRLLKEIGIMGSNGKIKNDMIRKYNQIDHFIELIDDMLKELAQKHEVVTVLDCACGKSYLSFVLNYYIKEVLKKNCRFIGLDYSDKVIKASKNIAENLGYKNMEFYETDINSYTAKSEINLVISLHACDTATDEAMALAVRNNVTSMVMVPCCHREMLSQYSYEPFSSILKHGILKARIADALTDGMRALLLEAYGYKVSVIEYISPLETPKNLMIRAERKHPGQSMIQNKEAMDEYQGLKSLLNVKPSLERLLG